MITIIGISGSLRRASLNTALLWAAAELAPEGTEVRIGTIGNIYMIPQDVIESFDRLLGGQITSNCFLPEYVGEFRDDKVRRAQENMRSNQFSGFFAAGFIQDPLRNHARINDEIHQRLRSSRIRSTESVLRLHRLDQRFL